MAEKNRDEIEKLKREWQSDPIWDLESTEGFEAHHAELKAFSAECHARWERQRAEREARETDRIAQRATELGCSPALVVYIETLEKTLIQRVAALEVARDAERV